MDCFKKQNNSPLSHFQHFLCFHHVRQRKIHLVCCSVMYYQVVPVGGLLLILVFSPRIDVQSQFCRIQKITSWWVFLVGYLLGGFLLFFWFLLLITRYLHIQYKELNLFFSQFLHFKER